MASYRARLERDLDRWVAEGLVPAGSRGPILAEAHEPRRLDAASALGLIGALLLGAAAVAFIAANWDGMARLLRFGLILAAFLAAVGGAAEAARRNLHQTANALTALSALLFAAALGLTGQIFDIVGDPQRTLWIAGGVALALGAAGRSSAAAIIGLALIGAGDVARQDWAPGGGLLAAPLLAFAAPLGMLAGWRWRSIVLAHAASLAWMVGLLHFALDGGDQIQLRSWIVATFLAGLAVLGRLGVRRGETLTRLLYGWCVLGALLFLATAGATETPDAASFLHRTLWLAVSLGVVVLGRTDRHGFSTTAGGVSLLAAVMAVLLDLGLGLMAAAGLFLAFAILALLLGWRLRRRAQ